MFGMTHTLFRDNPLPPPPKSKPKPKPQPGPVTINPSSTIIPDQQSPGYTPASTSPLEPPKSQPPTTSKDKEPMHQFSAHTINHQSSNDDQTSYSSWPILDWRFWWICCSCAEMESTFVSSCSVRKLIFSTLELIFNKVSFWALAFCGRCLWF